MTRPVRQGALPIATLSLLVIGILVGQVSGTGSDGERSLGADPSDRRPDRPPRPDSAAGAKRSRRRACRRGAQRRRARPGEDRIAGDPRRPDRSGRDRRSTSWRTGGDVWSSRAIRATRPCLASSTRGRDHRRGRLRRRGASGSCARDERRRRGPERIDPGPSRDRGARCPSSGPAVSQRPSWLTSAVAGSWSSPTTTLC